MSMLTNGSERGMIPVFPMFNPSLFKEYQDAQLFMDPGVRVPPARNRRLLAPDGNHRTHSADHGTSYGVRCRYREARPRHCGGWELTQCALSESERGSLHRESL